MAPFCPSDVDRGRAQQPIGSSDTVSAMTVRVRFAPSPTGSLHLGNALSAVANRTYADEHDGVLVLRIDDTDPERNVAGGEEAILADLAWLGVTWDEGPISQSSRAERHAEAAALDARRRCRPGRGRVDPARWHDARSRGRIGDVPARDRRRRHRSRHHAHHPRLGPPAERRRSPSASHGRSARSCRR